MLRVGVSVLVFVFLFLLSVALDPGGLVLLVLLVFRLRAALHVAVRA